MNEKTKRIIFCLIGVLIIGLGCALFRFSRCGNDASSAFTLALSDKTGLSLGLTFAILNCIYLIFMVIWGRNYLGPGTVINGLLIGYIIDFFYNCLCGIFPAPETLPVKLLWLIPAVIVVSFGVSLYQAADVGIGPYDYLAIGLHDHLHFPYFVCRMFTDSACALGAFLLGGLLGIGTLCALALGPVVEFFNVNVSYKIMPKKETAE